MSNTTVNKSKKRAARERLNKLLSVLLSIAMVLQTSPVAYARWDEGGAEGYSYDAAALEEMMATSEEEVAEPEVELQPELEVEPQPELEPQVEEQAPVDEVATNSSNTVEAPEGTDVAEQTAEIAEQQVEEQAPEAMASISVYVENATLTIDGNQLTNSTGTMTMPAGKAVSFSVAAAEGFELKEDSVKVSVDGFESVLAGNGSYSLAADQVKDGTMIIVRAAKADTKAEYMYEDDYVRVTATLDSASAIPDDAVLSVTPIYEGSAYYNYDAYMEALNSRVAGENTYDNQNTLLYDVAFLWVDPATGKTVELQPEEGAVTVKFTFRQRQLSDGLQAGSAANIEVNHLPLVDSAKEATTYESTNIAASDVVVEPMGTNPTNLNTLEVRTDSFSVFAFSYTVDFTYDGYTFKLEGNGSIMLSQILSILNIPVNMADIAAVDFTNYDLLSLEKQGDDWKVTSLQSFDAPETLTITLANGNKYVIDVTDPETDADQPTWDLGDESNTMWLHVKTDASVTENEQERDAAFGLTFTYQLEEAVVRAIDACDSSFTLVYDVSKYLADSPIEIKEFKNRVISVGSRRLGTYKLENGKVYLEFTDTAYFNGRTTFTGFFKVTAETDATKLGNKDEWEYKFPGTGDTVTIHYKKTVEEGTKSVNAVKNADGSYTLHYTANIKLNDDVNSLVFNDTLGGLQTLDPSSVKIAGKSVAVTQSGQNFSFDVATALGTTGVAKGTYQVTYDTTITEEQLKQMSTDKTTETNTVSWKVNGDKDVPGGDTTIDIPKPKEPIPVVKTIADGQTKREPGKEITYNITYGNDKTVLSGFRIADYMTDLQVPQGKITISYNGESIEIDPSAASTDDNYSKNLVTLFEHTFPEGTPGNGPVTVTYKAKVISAEDAKNSGIYDTTELTNTAQELRQNTQDTVKPTVDFEKEPEPPKVTKVDEGEYAPGNTINYTLTVGDANTPMAGIRIWDEMTDLQTLNTDSVMITVNDSTMPLSQYVADAITYTDDGRYGDNTVKIFDFLMPSTAGNGPVVITYSTTVISQDTAHAQNIYGNHNINNTGHGNKGSYGTTGVGPFGEYPITKTVTQDDVDVNAKTNPGATVQPGSTVHYTMTYGKDGMNLAGATITDVMTYFQELVGDVTITKPDGSSYTMPMATGQWSQDGVAWSYFADENYRNEKLRVFSYKLPDNIGTGKIIVEYDAQIISEDQAKEKGLTGTQKAFNDFTVNNHTVETEIDIEFPKAVTHKPQVRKEFDHWDVENSLVYWNIIVEKDADSAYPIENVSVREAWDRNHVYVTEPNQGWNNYNFFTAKDFDITHAVVTTDDGTVLTPGVDYTINKDDTEFIFPVLNERVHINLAFISEKKIIDGYKMKNEVRLNNGQQAIAEQTYNNPKIDIMKNGDYDESSRIVTWVVQLNPTKKEFIDSDPLKVMFTDVIPSGLTLVNYNNPEDTSNPTIYVDYQGDVVHGHSDVLPVTVDGDTNSFTADVAGHNIWGFKNCGLNKQKIVVTYKTKLSDEEWDKITSSASGSEFFTNKVEVTAGDGEKFGTEHTVEITSDGYLKKYDTTSEDEHHVVIDEGGNTTKEISYKVEINPNSNVLNSHEPLQLTDYISTNMDLKTDSVKLYSAEKGTDGKLVPGDEAEGVEISYNDDSRLLSLRNIPDGKPFLLTYSCYARSQGTDTYRNTATLIGGGSHSSTVVDEHNVQTNDAGVRVDGIEMNLHKIDENNVTKDLEGAVFQLYECELAIGDLNNTELYPPTYWENLLKLMNRITAGGGTAAEIEQIKSQFKIVKYKPVGEPVVTDSSGYTPQWSALSEHKLYAWQEVTAPENYTGNTDLHYFVGYQHIDVDADVPQPLLPEGEQQKRKEAAWALDDACQLANDIRVASMANLTTWTATNVESEYTSIEATKVWEGDSDNLYETRPTAGIVLTLYRVNADGTTAKVTAEDVPGISNPVHINVDDKGNWPTYIWNKLPAKDDDGNTIKYTVVEDKVDDYTTSYSDGGEGVTSGNITVTNKMIPKNTEISVKKEWGTGTEQPDQLPVTLMVVKSDPSGLASEPEDAESVGVLQTTWHLSAAENWEHTWTGLPTVEVEVDEETGAKTKYTLTYLVKEDASTAAKYNVTYTVDGKTVPAAGIIKGTILIKNDIKPTKSPFEAEKSFEGGELQNKDAKQFSFQLSRVDSESQKTPLQTVYNDGSAITFDDVEYTNDMLDGETEKTFTYEIVEVPGNDSSIAYDTAVYTVTEVLSVVDGKLTVGNRRIFKTVDGEKTAVESVSFVNKVVGGLKITKTWDGIPEGADLSGLSIKITGPDGEHTITYAEFDKNGEYVIGTDLPVGTTYTVEETNADTLIANYTLVAASSTTEGSSTVAKGEVKAIDLVNTYEQATGGFKIQKVVTENGGDVTSDAAKAVLAGTYTFTVYTDRACTTPYKVDGRDLTVDVVIANDGVAKTSDEITGMPVGTYWIKETEPTNGSEPLVNPVSVTVEAGKTGEAARIATVTNNYETVQATVTKVWNDKNDADDKRPTSLVVNLKAGYEVTDSVTLNASNNWTAVKTGLPKYDADGSVIAYTWSEVDLPADYKLDGTSTSGTITTITNTELTEASVLKVWNDHNNKAGLRPASLTVKLMNGTTEVEAFTLNEENDWSAKKTDLPKYDATGAEITYTWTEDETGLPEGYKFDGATISGTITTLTNSYDVKTSASVRKVWDDKNDQAHKRPASLTVKLMSGTTEVETFTLNAGNNWTAEKTGLSKYDAGGNEINYTWDEDETGLPEGYELTGNTKDGTVTTLTNSYSTEETQATVVKVWNDHDNEDRKRPTSLTVTLKADDEVYETYTITAGEGWTKTVTGLPKKKDGQEIVYTWAEDEAGLPDGYELTSTEKQGTITTITNTHVVKTESSVEKVWNDNNNADGKRPARIDVTFKKNGTTVETVTLNEDNNWSAKKTGLPKYDDQGKEIAYAWEEASAPSGYELTDIEPTGAHTKLTNTELTEATVKKIWDDNNDQDGIRPTSLTVKLMNGTTEAGSVTLTADKEWTDTITGLPKYDSNGNEINYFWSEVGLPDGYVMKDPSKQGTITTLTNSHIPEPTDASVKKVWNDNEDAAGKRPEAIEVNLQANGTTVQAVTLKAEEGWTKELTGLPKYKDGKEITYTWAEPTLTPGYKLTDTSKKGTLTTLTNTLGETEGEIKVEKLLSGRDWTNDDEFEFTISAVDGTPMPKDPEGNPVTSITIKKSDKTADGYVKSFGKITFTEAGEYTYTIKETKGSAERITYDETEHIVTLNVVEAADGSLAPAEGETLIKTDEFENTYTPDIPDFEKKVQDTNDSTGETSSWQDSADYDIGDDVPFQLAATLADDVTEYKQYKIIFEDEMEESLTFKGADSIKSVTVGGEAVDSYTLEEGWDAQHFQISLVWGDGQSLITDESLNSAVVEVHFNATLNESAKIGSTGNMNAAKLHYSNSPKSDEMGETGWDNVIVFTYKVDFTKTDQTGKKPVTGAKFSLYKVMSDGSEKAVSEDNVGVGNVFSFKGLDDGKYVLKETMAPEGYRKANDITFTVTAEHTVLLDSDGWSNTAAANTVSDPARDEVLTSLTGNRTESGEIDPNDINKNITFTRTDDGLTATVMNDENAKATIEATKVFKNWDLFGDDAKFEFKLTAGTAKTFDGADIDDGVAPMPAGDGAMAYATKANATAKFGEIAYELPGIYTYTINEVDGGMTGVTYDTTDHTVTVTVNRSADTNTLKATVTYDGGKDKLEVKNTFEALKEHLEVTKELTGREWADGDVFTFELAAVSTGAPMPAKTTAAATKANGKVAKFGDVEFEKVGSYEYAITEVAPSGAKKVDDTHYLLNGITYDTTPHTVIIKVKKANTSNALEVESITYDGKKSLTVTNKYANKTERPTSYQNLAKTSDLFNQPLVIGLATVGLAALAYGIRRRRKAH